MQVYYRRTIRLLIKRNGEWDKHIRIPRGVPVIPPKETVNMLWLESRAGNGVQGAVIVVGEAGKGE